MSSLHDSWKHNKQISNLTFSGESIAGIRTGLLVRDYNILLDAGNENVNNVETIFITHGHADHIGKLHLIILENLNKKIKTTIYCPSELKNFLKNFIDSFLTCNYYNTKLYHNKYFEFIGLNKNDVLSLNLNKNKVNVQIFESIHSVPTISYGFIETSKRLKEEYLPESFGLDKKSKEYSQEIVKLKKSGKDMFNYVEIKKFVFCGDTNIEIFEKNKDILTFENIIIECTFFDESEIELAIERKHMHWIHLKPIVISNPNINFHLIHISNKYKKTDIEPFFENINNVNIF